MKIGFSNFMLIGTRHESSSALKVSRVASQKSPMVAAPDADDALTKRLKKQKEAFKQLAALPSPARKSQRCKMLRRKSAF